MDWEATLLFHPWERRCRRSWCKPCVPSTPRDRTRPPCPPSLAAAGRISRSKRCVLARYCPRFCWNSSWKCGLGSVWCGETTSASSGWHWWGCSRDLVRHRATDASLWGQICLRLVSSSRHTSCGFCSCRYSARGLYLGWRSSRILSRCGRVRWTLCGR